MNAQFGSKTLMTKHHQYMNGKHYEGVEHADVCCVRGEWVQREQPTIRTPLQEKVLCVGGTCYVTTRRAGQTNLNCPLRGRSLKEKQ